VICLEYVENRYKYWARLLTTHNKAQVVCASCRIDNRLED
jgi:hypothetical protein